MPISLICGGCSNTVVFSDSQLAGVVSCPHCAAGIVVMNQNGEQPLRGPRVPMKRPPKMDFSFLESAAESQPAVTPSPARHSQPVIVGPATKYCHECGEVIRKRAEICPACGVRQPEDPTYISTNRSPTIYSGSGASQNRLAAGLCGILLGSLGVHKFILGYSGAGIAMLLTSIFGACLYGIGPLVMSVIGLIEGIIYLTMSDRDFDRAHGKLKRPWF